VAITFTGVSWNNRSASSSKIDSTVVLGNQGSNKGIRERINQRLSHLSKLSTITMQMQF